VLPLESFPLILHNPAVVGCGWAGAVAPCRAVKAVAVVAPCRAVEAAVGGVGGGGHRKDGHVVAPAPVHGLNHLDKLLKVSARVLDGHVGERHPDFFSSRFVLFLLFSLFPSSSLDSLSGFCLYFAWFFFSLPSFVILF